MECYPHRQDFLWVFSDIQEARNSEGRGGSKWCCDLCSSPPGTDVVSRSRPTDLQPEGKRRVEVWICGKFMLRCQVGSPAENKGWGWRREEGEGRASTHSVRSRCSLWWPRSKARLTGVAPSWLWMLRAPRPPGFCNRNHANRSSPSRTAKCINVSRGPPSAGGGKSTWEENVETKSKTTKRQVRSTPQPQRTKILS